LSEGASRRRGFGHFPALDGLRGLALAGVLVFHARGALVGGYLGVDLFFVLSGFLITGLLCAEQDATGGIALRDFWIRRARRLFPALLALLPAIAVYAWVFVAPHERSGLRFDALATLGYVANWRAILAQKSYWELFAAPSPLEHTWSLAIEEQFYLLWPLVVAAVLRLRGRRALFRVTLLFAALSMAAMLVLFDPKQPNRAYLGTDTRAAGLFLGALLALRLDVSTALSGPRRTALDALGLLALLGLGVAWTTLPGDHAFLYRGGFWLTELGVLVLIACATSGREGLVARALSVPPLRWLGTLSYGAYLWHWPVDVVLTPERTGLAYGVPLYALQLAVSFAVALASYAFVEQPIRKHGLRVRRPFLVIAGIVASVTALVLVATRGGPRPEEQLMEELRGLVPADRRLLVLGDSTANSIGWTIRGLRQRTLSVSLGGKDGLDLLRDGAAEQAWTQKMTEVKPAATVVILSGTFLYGLTADGAWRDACYPAWDERFKQALRGRLAPLAARSEPVWVADVPHALGPYDKDEFRRRIGCINASIHAVMAELPRLQRLDLAELQCPGGECESSCDGKTTRPDGVHYDIAGGRCLARRILARLGLAE
jgi:peptidoglycan/LPS O-acetylase OafA/YrhL